VYTIKENAEFVEVASKEIGLEVNSDKTEFMVMSGVQNAERSDSTNFDNSSSERVDEFRYWGTTVRNQNSLQEEIHSSLNSRNACCHSVQNVFSSRLLSINLKNKIYGTIILPIFYMGVKLGHLHL